MLGSQPSLIFSILMNWINLAPPSSELGLTGMRVAGVNMDLRHDFRFIALNFGAEERSLTLGWIALEHRLGSYSGLAMVFSEVNLFEAAFHDPHDAGELEKWELRNDPDPLLLFFFAGGTLRVAAASIQAELVEGEGSTPASEAVQ